MQCPYCLENFSDWDYDHIKLRKDVLGDWGIQYWTCPNQECSKLIVQIIKGSYSWAHLISVHGGYYVKPLAISRKLLPDYISEDFSSDYYEACSVLQLSPKASAALSRRCLQYILREKWWYNQKDLVDQIQAAIDGKTLPSHITESIDAIRTIWNFSAHPIKNKSSWEITDVESGEAEWNLDTLEALFDYYFIQPEQVRLKREALNQKLQEAWKPLLK